MAEVSRKRLRESTAKDDTNPPETLVALSALAAELDAYVLKQAQRKRIEDARRLLQDRQNRILHELVKLPTRTDCSRQLLDEEAKVRQAYREKVQDAVMVDYDQYARFQCPWCRQVPERLELQQNQGRYCPSCQRVYHVCGVPPTKDGRSLRLAAGTPRDCLGCGLSVAQAVLHAQSWSSSESSSSE